MKLYSIRSKKAFMRKVMKFENDQECLKEIKRISKSNNNCYVGGCEVDAICTKCMGKGKIRAYAHKDSGTCWECKGRGYYNEIIK